MADAYARIQEPSRAPLCIRTRITGHSGKVTIRFNLTVSSGRRQPTRRILQMRRIAEKTRSGTQRLPQGGHRLVGLLARQIRPPTVNVDFPKRATKEWYGLFPPPIPQSSAEADGAPPHAHSRR